MVSTCTAWVRKKRKELIRELGFFCQDCGSSELIEIDHITPIKQGDNRGSFKRIREALNNMDNIQLLCSPCHKLKTRRDALKVAVEEKDVGNGRLADADGMDEFLITKEVGHDVG